MKTFFSIIAFVLVLGVGYFFFFSQEEIIVEELGDDSSYSSQVAGERAAKVNSGVDVRRVDTSPEIRSIKERDNLSDEEIKEIDDNIAALEKKWDERLKNLFLDKLGLSLQDFEDYTVMRDGYEEDRLEAFENFHKEMAEKHGSNYRYSPTLEMKDYDTKIKREYHDLFRKRFGDQAFAQYMGELESFNDEARKESDPELGVLYIEY